MYCLYIDIVAMSGLPGPHGTQGRTVDQVFTAVLSLVQVLISDE